MKRVSAILTADMHLRETSPICRTDNFLETQTRKLKWLSDLQKKHDCPILVAGDLFDYHKPSPWLLGYALRNLPDGIIAIPGQHDLPAHNLENIEKSGIQVLSDAGKIQLITDPNRDFFTIGHHVRHIDNKRGNEYVSYGVIGFPWGVPWDMTYDGPKIALIHYGVFEAKPHYPGAELSGGTAKSVLNKLKDYQLVVAGDNHLSFTYTSGDRTLVNSGSFMRTSASQIDHEPSVYLWCAETNQVERVYILIEKDAISREHISSVEQRDERLEAFISKLDHNMEISVNFSDNLTRYISQNKISKQTETLIWESMI